MVKAATIVNQLINVIPTLTNLFTDNASITSLTRSGNIVTATTSTPHGLATGNSILINGAIAPVVVTQLTSSTEQDDQGNDIYIAHGLVDLNTPHDLTEGYQETILISGVDQSGYNGNSLPLLSVPNRYEFTYQLPSEQDSPATGDLILLWDGKERGYNGLFQITVTSPTTFTYTIDQEPLSPALGTIVATYYYRISYSAVIERFVASYTAQLTNKYWMCVILDDKDASQDRFNDNDAIYAYAKGNGYRQILIQKFSVYISVPTPTQIAGQIARDSMEDIENFLFKSLLGVVFPSGFSNNIQQLGTVFYRSSPYLYAEAYYIHRFEFQIINYIAQGDIYQDNNNVAFRDISIINYNSPHELMTLGVNLDDEPYVEN